MLVWTLAVLAASAAGLFRYNSSGGLEHLSGGSWIPARIETDGKVSIFSGGSWFNSGFTQAELIAAGITPPSSSGDSAKTAYDQATAAAQQIVVEKARKDAMNTMMQQYWAEQQRRRDDNSCGSECSWVDPQDEHGHPHRLALADVLAAKEGWNLRLDGQVDYSHTDFTFAPDASIDSYSAEVGATWSHDRWRLGLALPYEQVNTSAAAAALESYRTGLSLRPSYRLLDDKADGLNLDVIGVLGYSYAHYDNAGTFGLRSSTNHLATALGLLAGRTTNVGYFGLGYLYYPTWNLDGDKEANGNSRLDLHVVGAAYIVPLQSNLLLGLGSAYSYAPGLAPGIDRQQLDASANLTLLLNERWSVGCHGSHTFLNDSARTWGVGLDVGYRW